MGEDITFAIATPKIYRVSNFTLHNSSSSLILYTFFYDSFEWLKVKIDVACVHCCMLCSKSAIYTVFHLYCYDIVRHPQVRRRRRRKRRNANWKTGIWKTKTSRRSVKTPHWKEERSRKLPHLPQAPSRRRRRERKRRMWTNQTCSSVIIVQLIIAWSSIYNNHSV